MATTLPESSPCCEPCETPVSVEVPGPAGDDGAAGSAGTNGIDAFTTTVDAFNMPAEGADTASIEVGSSAWMTPNQTVYVQNAGIMEVRSKADATHVVLRNLENTASGLYPDNVAPGTNVPAGNQISPAGRQGINGAAAGALLAANNLSDVVSAAASRINLGLEIGVDVQAYDDFLTSIATLGTAADRMIYTTGVDTAAETTLTAAGRALLDDASASDQRTTLGLGTLAVQNTVDNGDWSGANLAIVNGGTGAANKTAAFNNLSPLSTAGDILFHDGANNVRLPTTNGAILTTNGSGVPTWLAGSADETLRHDGTSWVASSVLQNDGTNVAVANSLFVPLVIGGTATTSDLTFKTTTGVGTTGADMHFLVGNNGATEAMTILNSGNVGIGTTTPNQKLDVNGTIAVSGLQFRGLTHYTGADSSATFDFNANDISTVSHTFRLYRSTNTTGTVGLQIFKGDNTSTVNHYLAGNTNSFLAANNGNVGIGTTGPDRLLHAEVSDAVTNAITYAQRLSHITSGTAAAGFGVGTEYELEGADGTNLVAGAIEVLWADASTGAEDADMVFKVATGGAVADHKMRLTSGGTLAVGTPTPNANAILDLTSTTKAFMPPRMTTAQRDAIPAPTDGMIIWNTTTGQLEDYNSGWAAV